LIYIIDQPIDDINKPIDESTDRWLYQWLNYQSINQSSINLR